MRVVLDTNIIVSALLSPHGSPAEIITRWAADEFEIATSPALIAELERVLNYPQVMKYLKTSSAELIAFLRRLKTVAIAVEPQITLAVITSDPDDNRVLECAVTGGAAYIVSGDEHLLSLGDHDGIVILNASGFLTAIKLAG